MTALVIGQWLASVCAGSPAGGALDGFAGCRLRGQHLPTAAQSIGAFDPRNDRHQAAAGPAPAMPRQCPQPAKNKRTSSISIILYILNILNKTPTRPIAENVADKVNDESTQVRPVHARNGQVHVQLHCSHERGLSVLERVHAAGRYRSPGPPGQRC